MRRFFEELKDFTKKCDWVLLILCMITSGFGTVVIASATNAEKFGDNNIKYIIIQLAATALGVLAFAIILMNFLADVLYKVMDPRINLS